MQLLDWLKSLLKRTQSRGDDVAAPVPSGNVFEQMIRSPDWAMVEKVLGDVPPTLRAMYESDVVLEDNLDVVTGPPVKRGDYSIAEFEALRPESRKHMWPELEHGCLVLAGDGFGNEFFLRAHTGPEWPVFFHDHETGEITPIADSLDAFLNMLEPSLEDEEE